MWVGLESAQVVGIVCEPRRGWIVKARARGRGMWRVVKKKRGGDEDGWEG